MNLVEYLCRAFFGQVMRTAAKNKTNPLTNSRWECPQCGVLKTTQHKKHLINGVEMCTSCKNKEKK